jgi:hypothetical protein
VRDYVQVTRPAVVALHERAPLLAAGSAAGALAALTLRGRHSGGRATMDMAANDVG